MRTVTIENQEHDIASAIEAGKILARQRRVIVSFNFNGKTVKVDQSTNMDNLQRDFTNSWYLGNKVIDHKPKKKLSLKKTIALDNAKSIAETKRIEREAEWKDETQKKTDEISSLIEGIELAINPSMEDDYKEYVLKNSTDGYSKGIVTYSELWAKLMQKHLQDGFELKDIAKQTSHDADVGGITGFMYGCAVNALSHFWVHGNELKKWHNGEYGQPEAEGVVNPAVLVIQ